MLGSHCVKHWSSTQTSIALSSGEAEFAGVLRGAGQGLGYQALLKDLGVEIPLRVWTDSSAAIGICNRQGLGKLRHLDTHTLWIQQAVRTARIDLRKVLGEENPADLLTKHSLSRQRLEALIPLFGCRYLGGRAATAPQMRKGDSSRVTMAEAQNDAGDEEVAEVQEETSPCMPHLKYSVSELDTRYSPLIAPPDDGLEDISEDRRDGVYQHGLGIAAEIRATVAVEGRRRRPGGDAGIAQDNAGQDRAMAVEDYFEDLHHQVKAAVTQDQDEYILDNANIDFVTSDAPMDAPSVEEQ